MEQVAEEYGYRKQARERMVDMAYWTRYPSQSIPTFDKAHPQEPPPILGDMLAMPLSAKHIQETPLQAQVGGSWF